MSDTIEKPEVPFTQIANVVLNCRTLSFKAKGIYAFMICKPKGWNFTINSMAKQVKDGKAGIHAGIKELKDAGWVSYVKHQDGTGTYRLRNELKPLEITEDKPKPEKQDVAAESHIPISPSSENPDMAFRDVLVRKKNSNKDSISNKDIHTHDSQIDIVNSFKPNEASESVIRESYPNINNRMANGLVLAFIDKMLERTLSDDGKPWVDIQSQFRNYVRGKWIKPVEPTMTKQSAEPSYGDLGIIIQHEKERRQKGGKAVDISQLANQMRTG